MVWGGLFYKIKANFAFPLFFENFVTMAIILFQGLTSVSCDMERQPFMY